jgi:hypothetical protein
MTDKLGKDLEGSGRDTIEVLFCLQGLRKIRINGQESWWLGLDSNRAPPWVYSVTAKPTGSVSFTVM